MLEYLHVHSRRKVGDLLLEDVKILQAPFSVIF